MDDATNPAQRRRAIEAMDHHPRRTRAALTVASGLLTVAGLVVHAARGGGLLAALGIAGPAAVTPVPARILFALAILAAGGPLVPKAYRAIVRLRADMNLLMTVAVVGAVGLGDWFEAATVTLLFSVSLWLESWSVARARHAVAALLDLAPPTARVQEVDGAQREVRPEEVAVGRLFLVRPGERIPLDGRVVRGVSHVDQAPITGESVAVAKGPGDDVFAGTINGDGLLEAQCTKLAADSTLAHIIRMVGQAQSRRAPLEQSVERFARIYTPVVMALAAAVLVLPPLFWAGAWADWCYRSLVLLVIACPCALVISTPVSIVAALAAAARHGVLIKGGIYVEAPARLQAMAIDKTGTLTEGRPTVVDVIPLSGHTERELLARAAALEAHSNHPLARAIVAAAEERGVAIEPGAELEVSRGQGAEATIDGRRYWLGSHRYLRQRGQETMEVESRLEALSGAGRTVVLVGQATHVCGLITLADSLRPGAAEVIAQLRAVGVRHVVLLTGDNQATAAAIGRRVGVDQVQAELLPDDKVRAVAALVDQYGQVAMVGDGVNDAPALGRATVGIAMGAVGSDAAIETADIALMADDLTKLPWLIRHARRTRTIIGQNIGFALAVKILFVALTLTGGASLWGAIVADMGTSLLVIGNGLRLLKG